MSRGELGAVVSRVSLAEFGIDELRAHADDPVWLEAAVRAMGGWWRNFTGRAPSCR